MAAHASTAVRPGARGLSRRTRLWLGRLAVPPVLALLWALAAARTDLIPGIGATVSKLVEGFTEGWILDPLWDTGQAVLGGFAIATALGVPAGIALGRSRYLGRLFDPVVDGLFAVPRIILYPVLLAAFGVGVQAKLWMAVISAFFPIVMNTAAGMRDVSPTLEKLGRSMNASRLQLVRKIYLPAATPSVMVGLRIGFSISLIAVIIAELFATPKGLGRLIERAYAFQDLPEMFAVVLLICLIAFASNLGLWTLERRLRATVA
jgi:NitT/TauT family transport system permease protein